MRVDEYNSVVGFARGEIVLKARSQALDVAAMLALDAANSSYLPDVLEQAEELERWLLRDLPDNGPERRKG